MAANKVTRSKSSKQTQAQTPPKDYQVKAGLFETLRHLNRGYGVALAALDKLAAKDRLTGRRIFPAGFLADYRNRTEGLRALVNHDVLLLVAGREREEADRFSRLSGGIAKTKTPLLTLPLKPNGAALQESCSVTRTRVDASLTSFNKGISDLV